MYDDVIRLVGPNQAVEIFGVKLVGITAENGKKVLISIFAILITILLRKFFKYSVRTVLSVHKNERIIFGVHQVNLLATTFVLVIVLTSI